jgi:hypothetical protein
MCCALTENNRSRFVQRNGNNRVLSRYNYEFYIVVGIIRVRLSVSIRCLCGTYSKTTGFNHMPLRHIEHDYRLQSYATAAHTARLPASVICLCGTYRKTIGFHPHTAAAHTAKLPAFSHMPLRHIQQDYRLSVICLCGTYSKTNGFSHGLCGTYSKTTGFSHTPLRHIQQDCRFESVVSAVHIATSTLLRLGEFCLGYDISRYFSALNIRIQHHRISIFGYFGMRMDTKTTGSH